MRLYDTGPVHRLDERNRGLVEERRVARPCLQKHVVDAKPALQRHDVLDHSKIVMRRAGAEHQVLGARPEIGDVDLGVELRRVVHAADPPARPRARREHERLAVSPVEGAYSGDLGLARKRLPPCRERRRRALRRQTGLVYRLFPKKSVRRID